ncbi:hypothetical protein O3G_MSEX002940 [Manduca sexta]|nr:hypothetical protein O3G_MSEX002940 [Manduca sexta]
MLEVHSEHYLIRIPKKMKFKLADDLARRWQKFFKSEHVTPDSSAIICEESSDDEPITKYVKNYDTGIELTEEIKNKIRNEVTRILDIPLNTPNPENKNKKKRVVKKRPAPEVEKASKKQKIDDAGVVPEVAFADVNELNNQAMDVKLEIPETFVPVPVEPQQPMLHMKVSDDLTELMIEMNDQKTIYKF